MKRTFAYIKGGLVSKSGYEYYNKGRISTSYTDTMTYAKLYCATDYDTRVTDYGNVYPFESYGNGGDGLNLPVSRFAGWYAQSMAGVWGPRETRMNSFIAY